MLTRLTLGALALALLATPALAEPAAVIDCSFTRAGAPGHGWSCGNGDVNAGSECNAYAISTSQVACKVMAGGGAGAAHAIATLGVCPEGACNAGPLAVSVRDGESAGGFTITLLP